MSSRTYAVTGMSCQHCVNAITSEVSRVTGVAAVSVDLDAGTVTVSGDAFDDGAVRSAVDEAGYEVAG